MCHKLKNIQSIIIFLILTLKLKAIIYLLSKDIYSILTFCLNIKEKVFNLLNHFPTVKEMKKDWQCHQCKESGYVHGVATQNRNRHGLPGVSVRKAQLRTFLARLRTVVAR